MSIVSNQILRILGDVETTFRRNTFRRLGVPLSSSNNTVVQDALVLLFASWYDLLTFNGLPVNDLHPRWTNVLSEIDIVDLVGTLKAADKLLLSFDSDVCSYESFKHSLRSTYLVAGRVIAPLKGLLERWYLEKDASQFSSLHQAFVFMSRLSLKDLTDLESKALEDYLEVEARLKSLTYEGEESSLEAKILSKWFPRSDPNSVYGEWRPSHGPGSVADSKRSSSEKYKNMGTDARIEYLDKRLPQGSTSLPRPRNSFERISKVVFVPKSVDKLRTISMEPATLQWYQQGFGRNIVDHIHGHRYLRRRINLYKQELNRTLAHDGSFDGYYSTIDLSAASDSVSSRLVKKLFKGTVLLAPMIGTRSSRTLLPNGEVVNIDKFAPMGSNLCFPTETLIFASIIEASIMRSGESAHASHYRVYGDDLVVETKYAQLVIDRLNQLGFLVNDDKSFTSTHPPYFRESCGGEYLDGAEVTPVRLSRKFSGIRASRRLPLQIEAMIQLCNDSYATLPSVRRWTIQKLLKLPIGYRVRFDNTGETGLFSPTPSNYQLGPVKYHPDYQEYYYSCGRSVVNKNDIAPEDEDIRLYECLRLTDGRVSLVFPEDRVETSISGSMGSTWSRGNTLLPDQAFHAEPNAWEVSMEKGCK